MNSYYYPITLAWILILCPFLNPAGNAQQLALGLSEAPEISANQQEEKTLSSVLKEVEATFQVSFYYQVQDIENKFVDQNIRVDPNDGLEKTLSKLFRKHALTYKKVHKNYYHVFKKEPFALPGKIENSPSPGASYDDVQLSADIMASLPGYLP